MFVEEVVVGLEVGVVVSGVLRGGVEEILYVVGGDSFVFGGCIVCVEVDLLVVDG